MLVLAAIAIIPSVIGGYLTNRIDRKRQLVLTLVVGSLPLILVAFLNDLPIIIILSWIGAFFVFLGGPAMTSLLIEQAPDSRGTMMSMNTIFQIVGRALGAALGSLVLILSDWTGLILTFAALQLTTAAIFQFLTKDPCRTLAYKT